MSEIFYFLVKINFKQVKSVLSDIFIIRSCIKTNELISSCVQISLLQEILYFHHLVLVLVVIQVLKERDSLRTEKRLPVVVKIAPDLSTQDKQDIAEVIMEVSLRHNSQVKKICGKILWLVHLQDGQVA